MIMLVTLLLSLELTAQILNKPSLQNADTVIQLKKQIQDAENSLAKLAAHLASHENLDNDLGSFTNQSAASEFAAVSEKNKLLRSKISQLRLQEVELRQALKSDNTKWSERNHEVTLLEDKKRQLEALEAEATDLKNSQRVFYNQADVGGRQVYIVELFESDILAAQAGLKAAPQKFSSPGAKSSFLRWAEKQSTLKIRFVIIVHPGTTEMFKSLSSDLKVKGFKIGYDLLPSDKIAIDVEHGAG